jgi:hypothetical protein
MIRIKMDTRFAIGNTVQYILHPQIIFTVTEILIDDSGVYYTGIDEDKIQIGYFRQNFLELYE